MKNKLYILVTNLSVIGVFLALYLLYEYFALPHQSICYINSSVNCEASTKGVLANTLGIPTGMYGLVGYLVILVASIKKWKKTVFGVSLFGLLFCLRITFIELLSLKVICPVCVACQIVMILIFILAILINRKTPKKADNLA